MITFKNYIKAQTLEEAFQLNQSKRNCILGGMLWLRTGNKSVDTAIDLSDLNLDFIEEKEDCFKIGAMTTLRQIEVHNSLNSCFDNNIRKAVKNIVGVQFRNLATVGGSIWGRYGFSDVLTVFLSMDTYVELYKGGIIPLEKFIQMPKDNDILISIIINKNTGNYTYETVRIQKTDLPVITCAVSNYNEHFYCTVGARPGKAVKLIDENHILDNGINEKSMIEFAKYTANRIQTGSNMRGGSAYRKHLIKVLTERCLREIGDNL